MKYVSEEELRKWLITDGCAEGHGYIDEDDFVCMDWEDDICDDFDTIMQVFAQGVKSERARYKWTPVSNPPKESGTYLVTALSCSHEKYVTARSYALHLCDISEWDFENNNDAGWYDYDAEVGYYKLDNVLAWMSLPKPYGAESEEEKNDET